MYFSLTLLFLFGLLAQVVILLTLTSYFLLFFFISPKKFPRPKLFWPIIYRLNDFSFGRFEGNIPIRFFQVGCMFTNWFVEFFSLWKIISKIIGKLLVFLNFLLLSKNVYQLKERLFPIVPAYFPRVSFYLTPLSTAFEKVCGRILPIFFTNKFMALAIVKFLIFNRFVNLFGFSRKKASKI